MSINPSRSALTVERRGIEYIDEQQRHGNPRNQFSIRFSPVIYLAAIVLGGAAVPMGLGLTGSLTAIVLGNLLGAICTAACAVMGPRLGLPQIPMGRAAFGYKGNHLPAALSSLLYIGYFTVGTILGSKSLADLFKLPYIPVAIGVAIVSVLIAIFGYNLLHAFGRWVTRVSIVVLIVVSVMLVAHGPGAGADARLSGTDYWLAWLLEFTIVFSYTMSWAPYASDYSRYLPRDTGRGKIFGYAFAGLFLATTWMMALGAVLTTLGLHGGVLEAFAVALPGPILAVTLFVLGIAAIPHNSVNLYSGAMASLTWGLPLKRSVTVAVSGAIGALLAIFLGGPNFQSNFNAFLFLVAYYVTPWLAIICADFFWVHRGGRDYPPAIAFQEPRGPLAGVRWPGMAAFLIGIAVSVPFMATDLFTGPIGRALNGADLSYFVSFLVAGGLYIGLSRMTAGAGAPTPAYDRADAD
ncbi:purine-cytosine permease family protein [Pseudonocardia acaciae]|uniref:purine-cytosine permease family protein n=1 Tax=Pseudonocardia acaciae TaxID=551276 RepID=UPI00048B2A16|nr:cytosine permease [Pseudonocardia acaciae]